MGIFKRVKTIIKSQQKPEPVGKSENTLYDAKTGDIMEVDLTTYLISGKIEYYDPGFPDHRIAYYLQDGGMIRCLVIEKGRKDEVILCDFLEGALDNPEEVPSILVLDETKTFQLEMNSTDMARCYGKTDFRNLDEIMIWRYFADEDEHFYLQWQDGKYIAMIGEKIPPGMCRVIQND
jgi:hypothetical protein